MYTLKTKTGKEFESDLITQTFNPERLYIHVVNSTVPEVAVAFTTELPVEDYPAYTVFDSMNVTSGGVNICLRKEG